MKELTKQILIYFLIIVVFLSSLNLFIPKEKIVIGNETVIKLDGQMFVSDENGTKVTLKVPAVDPEGEGVPALLTVEATKGSGRTLVSIDNLLFWADTQHSIRMARLNAGNVSGKDLETFDLVYSIHTDATAIGGPSAGVAIALATIFALNNEQPRDDVMITGTINHDGTIGPVDNILSKAKAAKKFGAVMMLVPLLQSKDIDYEESEYCHKFGGKEVCTTEIVPREVDIENESGIKIVEVRNIQEALEYFKIN